MSDESSAYGPALPPHLRKSISPPSSEDDKEAANSFGPALPPSHSSKPPANEALNESTSRRFGPSLPPNFAPKTESDDLSSPIPSGTRNDEDSDDDFAIGPQPPSAADTSTDSVEYRRRILDFRLSQLSNDDGNEKKREEWMIVPPSLEGTRAGVVQKTSFLSKALPTDRDQSCWTDTAEDKRKRAAGLMVSSKDEKRKAESNAEQEFVKKRDREQEEFANKLKKKHKRDKSLIDIHTEKRKKEKAAKDEKQERKAFNRETDLQLSRMDSRQIKSVVNQAKLLDSRFSSGSNKFL